MPVWAFFDYVTSGGRNAIRDWLDGEPSKVQAKINTRLLFMANEAVWPQQFVSEIKNFDDLFELKVECFGQAYRIVAFYGPGRREVSFVFAASKKGKLKKSDLKAADLKRQQIQESREWVKPHEYDSRGPSSEPE